MSEVSLLCLLVRAYIPDRVLHCHLAVAKKGALHFPRSDPCMLLLVLQPSYNLIVL